MLTRNRCAPKSGPQAAREELRERIRGELLTHDAADGGGDPFGEFDQHIPHEAITHHHVHGTRWDVLAFHVPDKVGGLIAQQRMGSLHHLVAFFLFLADRK